LPAYAVHALTASGAAFALLSLIAAFQGDPAEAFFWLGVALIADGLDGPLARKINIAERVPAVNGETLDLVVDFTTYVFVPAAILIASGLAPFPLLVFLGCVIVASAAVYFADTRMKTEDNWFAGFPAVWNLVVFYLLIFPLPPVIMAALVIVTAVAQAFPVVFVHPIRVKAFRPLTIVMLVVWAVAACFAIFDDLNPGAITQAALLVALVYFVGLGILRRPKSAN
jgi:phosphatidylcholine synthase